MKFYGPVGFVEVQEKRPGVKTLTPVEYYYSGDVLKLSEKEAADHPLKDFLPEWYLHTAAEGVSTAALKGIKKTGDYSPTKYYDDAGHEIKLNTGKTYIGVAQKGHTPKFS